MIVFLTAPDAVLTGLRMSPFWLTGVRRLKQLYPIQAARAHALPEHAALRALRDSACHPHVRSGALRKLNHVYGARDGGTWWGVGIFAASIMLMAAAWLATAPAVVRSAAALTGSVTHS